MRARRGGAAAALASVAVLAFSCGKQPPPAATATPAASTATADSSDVATRTRRAPGKLAPVIWLGLDGLDFEMVDRLAAAGRMPNWKRLAAGGYTARLTSFLPILSPIVWTTLATGAGPDVHRVLDFQEVDPATGQKVPISGRSRAVPAIWNAASAGGLSVGVVGWWATHPAEEVKGFFVSDRVSPILFDGLQQQNVAFPTSLSPGIAQIVAREGRVEDAELARFVDMPVSEIAAGRASAEGLQNPMVALARTIGSTRIESRVARELYDRNLPDLMMLYFEGTDVIGHLFASYVPPKMACTADADFARYRGAVDEYYALVDRILGQWMRRAEEDGATLIVNSDHGFTWGADRSCEKGSLNAATAGAWHRIDGVFAAWGARVRASPKRGHASVFDVVPTVAALLGLPVDKSAHGEPIRAAFGALPTPERRDLVAELPVRRLASQALSEKEASEYSKKLMALGYLSGSDPGKLAPIEGDRPGMTEGAWNNLGLYLYARGGDKNLALAADAYEKAIALRADYSSPKLNLAVVRRARGDDARAIAGMVEAIEAGQADPEGVVLSWALAYGSKGRKDRVREVLEKGMAALPDSERVARALAVSYYQSRGCDRADAALQRFEAATQSPETLNTLALVRACLGRREQAASLFRRSLSLQPNQPVVVQSLSVLEGPAPGRRAGS